MYCKHTIVKFRYYEKAILVLMLQRWKFLKILWPSQKTSTLTQGLYISNTLSKDQKLPNRPKLVLIPDSV